MVPFHKADVGEPEAQAVADVIRSGWLTMGAKTVEFENEFAKYIGAKHAIAVSSATAGLHLALEAIGTKANDEVIVPANTFTATAEVVAYFGAVPVLADIDSKTLNLDPVDAEKRITKNTRAIIPVHYGGQACDMDEIAAIARRYHLHVIEDAAHSLPATYHGRSVGTLSELTVFSFYATKTLTTGEGGMITTPDPGYADRLRLMRLHGIGRDAWKRYSADGSWYYEVLEAGYKYNMTDMQAALGLVQLKKVDQMAAARARIAHEYNRAFGEVEELEVPSVLRDRESAWHLYPIRIRPASLTVGRDEFIASLKQKGIGTSVHFIPLHLHPYYQQKFGYKVGDLPCAEAEYGRYLSLPLFPTMTDAEIQYVVEGVLEIVRSHIRSGAFAHLTTD